MKKVFASLFALALLAQPALAEETTLDEKPVTEPRRYTPETQIIKDSQNQAEKDKAEAAATIAAGDPPEVAELKMKARDDVEAQHRLGIIYAEGEGVERNYDEALKWHRMAAENAHPDSQYYLGFAYENGVGVTRNNVTAAEWYLKAASQGHAMSQGALGNMYANGAGVEKNDFWAYIWLTLAKNNGETTYEPLLADVTKRIPPKRMKYLNWRVREWKPSAGEKTLSPEDLELE